MVMCLVILMRDSKLSCRRFVLLESRDLRQGQVRQVDALGLNLAVYRSSDSDNVFVTDAYCPHLGANIAVGGRVTGDCIQCPFHNWRYCGVSGQCVEVLTNQTAAIHVT